MSHKASAERVVIVTDEEKAIIDIIGLPFLSAPHKTDVEQDAPAAQPPKPIHSRLYEQK